MAMRAISDGTRWLDQIFEAKAAQDGGVVRRSVEDVRKYASVAALRRRVRDEEFHLIRTGNQYVILCHKGDLRGALLMPRGPRGQKPPADVIGAAVKVMRIAIGEEEDEREPAARAAATLGKLGGAARARNLSADQRREIARKAAEKRWSKE